MKPSQNAPCGEYLSDSYIKRPLNDPQKLDVNSSSKLSRKCLQAFWRSLKASSRVEIEGSIEIGSEQTILWIPNCICNRSSRDSSMTLLRNEHVCVACAPVNTC